MKLPVPLHFPEIDHGSSQYVLEEVFRSSQWDSFHERRYKAVEEDGDVRAHFLVKGVRRVSD